MNLGDGTVERDKSQQYADENIPAQGKTGRALVPGQVNQFESRAH